MATCLRTEPVLPVCPVVEETSYDPVLIRRVSQLKTGSVVILEPGSASEPAGPLEPVGSDRIGSGA